MRDPYELLDIPRSATKAEIKRSFRQLAKKLHPDANKDDATVAARFAELNSAYEILGDEKRRKAFDRGQIDAEGRPTQRAIARAKRRKPIMTGLVMAVMLATISILVVHDLTLQHEANANGSRGNALSSRTNEEHSAAQGILSTDPKVQPEAHVVLQQSELYASDDAIPLGLQVSGDTIGVALEISGLPDGTTLSSGRPLGGGRWRLLASDVGNTVVRPPAGFDGSLEFAVELRLADDTVIDSGEFRLQSLRASTESLPNGSAAASSDTSSTKVSVSSDQTALRHAAVTRLDHEQIDFLIRRSQQLISEGDVAAGRALLRRAAETNDARAALALGATYDPVMLTILKAHGVAGDVSLARDWYKKASELGSQEAQERLQLLASASLSGAENPRNIESGVAAKGAPASSAVKDAPAAVVTTKPRRHAIRLPTRAQISPKDSNGVYVGGMRVGADPDPTIRTQLLREDASRELPTDVAGRQLPANPTRPSAAAR
jgi:hypothetical protein